MNIAIEQLLFSELVEFLQIQADEAFPSLKDEQQLDQLSKKWQKYAKFCICRDANNQLVGMIVFYDNQPENKIVYLPHVYVSKAYRGTGTFTLLLDTIVSYVKEKGFNCIRLEVSNENVRAQNAYLKNGFLIDGSASEKSMYMKRII